MSEDQEKAIDALAKNLEEFLYHVESLHKVLPSGMVRLERFHRKSAVTLRKFMEDKCKTNTDDSGKKYFRVPREHFKSWKTVQDGVVRIGVAKELVPRSILVTMVSQYDAFLGKIVKNILLRKGEIAFSESTKTVAIVDILEYQTLDEFKKYFLEKEVESLLRKSHADQFDWLEKKFSIKLKEGLDSWKNFIEITERRNLFVHTDGIVSSQYMKVCQKHDINVSDLEVDKTRLIVNPEYFVDTYRTLCEIAIKLTFTLARKLFKEEKEAIDDKLISIVFSRIEKDEFNLAILVLEYARTHFKSMTEASELLIKVNLAQSYKWLGNAKKCTDIINSIDWSVKDSHFKLAKEVLLDNWDNAARLMIDIGNSGKVTKFDYKDWPLFREFRLQPEFLNAYQNIFNQEFEDVALNQVFADKS